VDVFPLKAIVQETSERDAVNERVTHIAYACHSVKKLELELLF
jgi:hypothetical protein